ncbi:hypothetical protein CCB80_03285 [Armatimonadetes bacterium Uphvl-Ar1]|nr:hypothetical protein CCB80_03285 [Armatimonadetes bacterium Uphvl-Ar1]
MIPFTYNSLTVRTRVGDDGEPWFCLADVGAVLEMKDPTNFTKSDWCDDEGVVKFTEPTQSGVQDMIFINEPNLYAMVMRSTKKEAKAFSRWVTHEVLPEIRKTGSYSVEVAPPSGDPFLAMLDGIKTLYIRQNDVENRIGRLEAERKEARERALALPEPTEPTRELSMREKCRQAVDELVRLSGVSHQEAWRRIYYEYNFVAGVNLTKRAEAKKLAKLDWIDKYGSMDSLYGIIRKMSQNAAKSA